MASVMKELKFKSLCIQCVKFNCTFLKKLLGKSGFRFLAHINFRAAFRMLLNI